MFPIWDNSCSTHLGGTYWAQLLSGVVLFHLMNHENQLTTIWV